MFVEGATSTTAELAGGVCALVCQEGRRIWAGIGPEALVEAMVEEAVTCFVDLVSFFFWQ